MSTMFKYVDLGARNTQLQFNPSFSSFLGVPFFIKRDDTCGSKFGLNGSDARKIEFLVHDIAVEKPDTVVIISSFVSNFTRMLVQSLANMVYCHVVYVDEFSPAVSYNLSAVQICGAHTHGQQSLEYANTLVQKLIDEQQKVYVVRPGGAQTVAAMGGYSLFDEIAVELLSREEISDATIYVSSDSGVTQAGMLSASGIRKKAMEHNLVVIGVPQGRASVVQSNLVAESYASLGALCTTEELRSDIQSPDVELSILLSNSLYSTDPNMPIPQSYVALATLFYQHTSLLVDYVYGLPVLSALVSDVKEGSITGPVVFVNPVAASVPYFSY